MHGKKTPYIYGFGSATLDFRIRVADMGFDYKEKLLARKTSVLGGGAVANCLVQVGRLGGNAFWLGKLGDDWIGNRIIEEFQGEKIDTSYIIQDSALCSPFNVAAYTEKQTKRIGGYLIPNSLAALTESDIELLSSHINNNDWVIVEIGEIPLDMTLNFCRRVKESNANLVVDVDLDPIKQCIGSKEAVEGIFGISDILAPNYNAVKAFFSPDLAAGDLAKAIADKFETTTIITVGAGGVFYCEPEKAPCHQKAFAVNVVDTVGAGDAFHGGLLYGLANDFSLPKAVKLGSQCAALNCQSFGARNGMPGLKDLNLQ